MKRIIVIAILFCAATGCVTSTSRNVPNLQPMNQHGEVQVRAGVDFINLPKESEEEPWGVSLALAPIRGIRSGGAWLAESFEERPWWTTLGIAATALTVGEVTETYGWTDLFDTTFSVRRGKDAHLKSGDRIEARDGAAIILRDVPGSSFDRHSIKASGKDTQVILDFNAGSDF